MHPVPSPAFWLGWAGVIPFAVLSAVCVAAPDLPAPWAQRDVEAALIAYAAIILGFMGGVQWGLEMTRDGGPCASGFAASVVPALVAFAAAFFAPHVALLVLAVGFAGLLVWDLRRSEAGVGPAWYPRLRLQLSLAVLLCLAAAAVTRLPVLA